MCEYATEMTARNEIEVLEMDERVKDRILKKYDDERAYRDEICYQERRRLEKEIDQKDIEIKALVRYIAMIDK